MEILIEQSEAMSKNVEISLAHFSQRVEARKKLFSYTNLQTNNAFRPQRETYLNVLSTRVSKALKMESWEHKN